MEADVGERSRLQLAYPHLADHLALAPLRATGVDLEPDLAARGLVPALPQLAEQVVPGRAGRGERGQLDGDLGPRHPGGSEQQRHGDLSHRRRHGDLRGPGGETDLKR